MAIIALVTGSFIGFLCAITGLLVGLTPGSALLVWLLAGNAASLVLYRGLRMGQQDRNEGSPHEEILALREAEARQAMLAISDASSMSRLMRLYTEQKARTASSRSNRRIDP